MLEMTMFKQTVTNFINTHWYGEELIGNGKYGWYRSGYSDAKIELKIKEEMGPYGPDWVMEATQKDNDASGGVQLYHDFPNLDHTNEYRFTIWVKLDLYIGNGRIYQGTSTNGDMTNISNNTVDNNPYFNSALGKTTLPVNEWVLLVGYIHPNGTGSVGVKSNAYRKNGSSLGTPTKDFKFNKSSFPKVRFLPLYYADKGDSVLWYHPRFEVVNGKEPSIADILARKCP